MGRLASDKDHPSKTVTVDTKWDCKAVCAAGQLALFLQLIRVLKEEVAKLRVVIKAEGLEAKVASFCKEQSRTYINNSSNRNS